MRRIVVGISGGSGIPLAVELLGQLCEKELHGNAVPYAYHFMDKLPATPAGKVDYRTLEQMAAK